MDGYLLALRRSFDVSGRSRRREFWGFNLISPLVLIGVGVLDATIIQIDPGGAPVLALVYLLAISVPSYTVLVRRLHDIEMSGRYTLWLLVPVLGIAVLWGFATVDSDRGDNLYGPNPKEVQP